MLSHFLGGYVRNRIRSYGITSIGVRACARRYLLRHYTLMLVIFLTLAAVPASAQVSRQPNAAKSRGPSLSIIVMQIGDAPIRNNMQAAPGPKNKVAYYYAKHREIVSGRLVGSDPSGVNLYPLVRREGTEKWQVQTAALKAAGRGRGAGWKAEVRFGEQTDAGADFELSLVASREPLPAGAVSPDRLSRSALVVSDIIRVRRRVEGVSVWVPHINNIPVYGNELIDVKLQTPVEVRARALPPEAQIGVAVQPVKPWTDRHWVMDSTVIGHEGAIIAHFGRLGLDAFDEFEVLAFVAWQDDFPPRGVGIPQTSWEPMEAKFLAKSRVIRVIRWQGEFTIKEIDGKKIIPRLIIPVDQQSDIYGAVSKPLNKGEKVWIICLPRGGSPWVAGWTDELHPAGRWVINAAQLWREGQPKLIDVVAVIAADDPTKVSPEELRLWIYQTKRTLKSVRVLITSNPAH
ncbi:MAG: hypothetical protein ACJ74J_05835 [Blastocatellia bacterium]